jgi:GH15 family glucan-1,4-alpha-glucosidase
MLRYATEDDFGLPHTAFNVCTFWLIEALYVTGRHADARALFEEMVARCTPPGFCPRISTRIRASCGGIIRKPIRWSA